MNNKWEQWLPKKNRWFILLLIGVLLVVIAIPTNTNSKKAKSITYAEEESYSEIEKRLQTLLENMQYVGAVDVMITYQEKETVEGVVVLAEGAGNANVVRDITDVVQALFDVDSHKIKVIERNLKTNQEEQN